MAVTMKESKKILQIDVEKVIRSKSEKLARKVPRFVINYLKRIIHQDELNDILLRRGEATGVDFATEMVDEFNIRYNIHSKTELDPTKRYIFVSNHPLGGMDGGKGQPILTAVLMGPDDLPQLTKATQERHG